LPGAEARKIKQKYDAKTALLRPELISGAAPKVLTAVMRAQELLDTPWQLLGDPDSRKRYDEVVGFRRSGGGLGQRGTGIESAGMAPADLGIIGELPGVDVVGGLLAWTGWLAPRRRRNRPGAVPDVRGLFFPVGLEVATRRGLRVRIVDSRRRTGGVWQGVRQARPWPGCAPRLREVQLLLSPQVEDGAVAGDDAVVLQLAQPLRTGLS